MLETSLLCVLPVAALGGWDYGVLAVYFAMMVGVTLYAARRDRNTTDYFLAGRSIPAWVAAVSITGAAFSGSTFVATPDESFLRNISPLILFFSCVAGACIAAALLVPRLYAAGTTTVYGYLEGRYGPAARVAGSVVFLMGRLLNSGGRLFVAATPLCILFAAGEPTTQRLVVAICVIGLIGTAYTFIGGIRAVVWVDVIQLSVVAGSAMVAIGVLLYRIPVPVWELWSVFGEAGTGVGEGSKLQLVDTRWSLSVPNTIWAVVTVAPLFWIASLTTDQDFAQRFLITKDRKRAALAVIGSQFVGSAGVAIFLFVGLLLWVFYQRPDLMGSAGPEGPVPVSNVFPTFLSTQMPPVFAGLAVAGFFAIAQGSMDSAINAMASSAVTDLYGPWRARRGLPPPGIWADRIATLLMGVLMTGFAILCIFLFKPGGSLFFFLFGLSTWSYSGLLGAFAAALLTRRGTAASAVAGMFLGFGVSALLEPRVAAAWCGWLGLSPLDLGPYWRMAVATGLSFAVAALPRGRGGDTASAATVPAL